MSTVKSIISESLFMIHRRLWSVQTLSFLALISGVFFLLLFCPIAVAQNSHDYPKLPDNVGQKEKALPLMEGNESLIMIARNNDTDRKAPFIFPSQSRIYGPSTEPTKQAAAAILNGTLTPQDLRLSLEALGASIDKNPPQMASITDQYIAGRDGNEIHIRIYDPGVEQKPSPALVFAHGGGWVFGSIQAFDGSIKRLANSSGLPVVAMDYRLSPEHPFPAGLNDVVDTVRWVLQNGDQIGIDPKRIALGGDSAGANLALSAALMLRDSGQQDALRALFLLYGRYTPDMHTESMEKFGGGEYGITSTHFSWVMNLTFQRPEDYTNPLAFPIYANMTGLPPMYIAAMGLDPLRDDSILLAEKLREVHQEHYLTVWPGVAHGALSQIAVTPEIQQYVNAMNVYLNGVLAKENDG